MNRLENLGHGGILKWINDGFCDDINNNDECDYDGGDCCEPHENSSWNQYCTNCSCLEVPACNPINGKLLYPKIVHPFTKNAKMSNILALGEQ